MVAFWALLVVLLASPLRDSPGVWPNPGDLLTPARKGPAMKPYYQTEDGSIRIFHARWEDVLAAGVFAPKDIALIHADPPYGIDHDVNGHGRNKSKKSVEFAGGSYGKTWPRVAGDAEPFSPDGLLSLVRPSVIWGANNFADKLPACPGWLIFDKKRLGTDAADMNVSDAELAWCNFGKMVRTFSTLWMGFRRETEVGAHYHPTQKPEALSAWVFAHAMARKKLKKGDTILVPYMGSGPDLRPAQAMGFNVIACEVAEEYCKTAVNARLRAVAKPIENAALGPLFGAL